MRPAVTGRAGLLALALLAATQSIHAGQDAKPASAATSAAQRVVASGMPVTDPLADADATRGFIASLTDAETRAADGHVVHTLRGYEFLRAEQAPDSVNPSLWAQARKQMAHGLYRVADGFYQVRGMDLANMSIVEGQTGLVVIDPLMTAETARAALELYYRHRPRKPVLAVFYNHSHVDHYGGVKGIVDEADVKAGKVQIIAPAGFMRHAIDENVLAGNAMNRRAAYQFGTNLARDAGGLVDLGGAKAMPQGTITLIAPTRHVTEALETMVIDGIEIVNLLAPGAEAPAELVQFFPRHRVLDMGELATPTQHQLLALRGAGIRDGRAWARYLNLALARFGADSAVLVGQHGAPVFGTERLQSYLAGQRDMYQWLHDQPLRLMNHGYKPAEIAQFMRDHVPANQAGRWDLRGYYGSVQRNAKAVYQQYMGWYDGNPANLDVLTDADYGRKFVAYGGGAEAVLRRARADFANGEYRWVAQAMSHLVFAEPGNRDARTLAADALEQLGYQAEAAPERNAYLSGADELRHGKRPGASAGANADIIAAMSTESIFDLFGVRLNGPRAEGRHIVLNWEFSDGGQRYLLNLQNAALTCLPDHHAAGADATLRLSRATLDAVLLGRIKPQQAVASGLLAVEGRVQALGELLALLDTFPTDFELIAPNPAPRQAPRP